MDQRWLVERARDGDHDAFSELARAAVVRLDRAEADLAEAMPAACTREVRVVSMFFMWIDFRGD